MSYEEVAEKLDYNPETGDLTWKEGYNHRYSGQKAGCIHDVGQGYLKVKHKNKRYRAHKLAWIIYYGEIPTMYIDHIDGNPTNNKIDNLRLATNSLNQRNQKMNKNNKSGFVGVYLNGNRFYVTCAKKRIGSFDNYEDAVAARVMAEKEMGGFTKRHGR